MTKYVWPRSSVLTFASAMETKLRANDVAKGPWETESQSVLMDWLQDEVRELAEALQQHLETFDHATSEALMGECVDVANMAMMIFSQEHPLARCNRSGVPEHAVPKTEGVLI